MRIFCYAQHLSGVGHFVRTHALACGLAEAHEVVLVDGGRPVPRLRTSPRLALLSLTRIHHRAGVLVALDGNRPLAEVREERLHRLVTAIAEAPPDVVTIEHYPFSKWDLEDEILAVIGAARRVRPAVGVVCSLRDVVAKTRYEAVGDQEYERRVLDRLATYFDALLIHADARFSRLEEHFPGARSLPIPCAYTGFVSTAEAAAGATNGSVVVPGASLANFRGDSCLEPPRPPYAVLSAGGGARALPFLSAAIEAFDRLSSQGELGSMRLVVFAGLFMKTTELDRLRAVTRGGLVTIVPFSPEFPIWLRWSELSISQAGYNTCVDLLSTGVPAVLVPDPGMSDQFFRAERMRIHGLAALALGDPPPVDTLMDAIRRARSGPRARHDFGLRGVDETRVALERLHRTGSLVPRLTDGMSESLDGRDLEPVLGRDLLALVRAREVPLTKCIEITTLPSSVRRRGAFLLEFADGTRLKGRRLESAERADTVARLHGVIGHGFPRILGRRGAALLLEWVEGRTLASLDVIPSDFVRRCGSMLGELHRAHAEHSIGDRPPSSEDLFDKLARNMDLLGRLHWMDAGFARRALAAAAAYRPLEMTLGIIHKDFCAANIVLGPDDSPICVDNASLSVGAHDLDLARTWYRWPMSPDDRAHFASGYEEQRSLAAFLKHFAFWATCVLVGSAATRLRSRVGGVREPIDRVRVLVGRMESQHGAGHPFWIV